MLKKHIKKVGADGMWVLINCVGGEAHKTFIRLLRLAIHGRFAHSLCTISNLITLSRTFGDSRFSCSALELCTTHVIEYAIKDTE